MSEMYYYGTLILMSHVVGKEEELKSKLTRNMTKDIDHHQLHNQMYLMPCQCRICYALILHQQYMTLIHNIHHHHHQYHHLLLNIIIIALSQRLQHCIDHHCSYHLYNNRYQEIHTLLPVACLALHDPLSLIIRHCIIAAALIMRVTAT